jgi:site-specific DNA-methyltransferase (adenine-specific)
MLKNQDSLEFLSTLKNNSVDLIITDPPYFIGFDGGKGWDSQWKDEDDYLSWCGKWTTECIRVLKPNRMLIVFGTLKTDTFLKYKLQTSAKNPCLVSQPEIIWSYNWGGRTKKNFARKHEYAWVWSIGNRFLFNADDVRVERKMASSYRECGHKHKTTIPTCVWEKNNHTMSKEYVGWHPTQKPIEILERMVLAYSNEGDTVMDIFSGSGSTMIAAQKNGRNFIGCEIDTEYYTKSLKRGCKQ